MSFNPIDPLMEASIITPEQTINHKNIVDMVINTPNGQKHIKNSNGNVDLVKRGKIQILLKREGSDKLETVELYVNNGVSYVENKVINIVTDIRENPDNNNTKLNANDILGMAA